MNENKIKALCDEIIMHSRHYLTDENYQKCIHYTKVASRILYAYNWRLYDKNLEDILKQVSSHIKIINNVVNKRTVILYDSISIDNRGLTQQYVDAIIQNGYNLCYMTNRKKSEDCNKRIIDKLKSDNCEICYVPSFNNYLEKSQYIYNYIMEKNASKVFMHLRPDSVSEVITFYALPNQVEKYQINLTNHAFWLGKDCFDYSLEFNEYGFLTSEYIRNISRDKLLYLPFYPISEDSTPYENVPKISKDRVVLMSGGVVYKITDSSDTFLNNIRNILIENPNTIFLWAGGGDLSYISSFIEENNLEKRFFLIGNRSDINSVMDKIDIYVNTYPVGGGLMCQLAAIHKKPILSYAEPENETSKAEQTICQMKNIDLTFINKEDLLEEATKLINNEEYRKQRGEEVSSCIINKEQFDELFKNLIYTHKNLSAPPKLCNDIPHHFSQLSTDEEVIRMLVKELKMDIFRFPKYILPDLLKFLFSFRAIKVLLSKLN